MYIDKNNFKNMVFVFNRRVKMKVLVLSITAGQGHNATGKALCDMLISMGAEAVMIDTYDYINTALSDAVSDFYLMSTALLPGVYGKAYTKAEQKKKSRAIPKLWRLF